MPAKYELGGKKGEKFNNYRNKSSNRNLTHKATIWQKGLSMQNRNMALETMPENVSEGWT